MSFLRPPDDKDLKPLTKEDFFSQLEALIQKNKEAAKHYEEMKFSEDDGNCPCCKKDDDE